MKILSPGKVVIVLQGRFAGKKAIVVKAFAGTVDFPFPHCLVAGIERPPQKVTKSMDEKTLARRVRVKPFVKFVNVRHLMPTRYTVDLKLDTVVKAADFNPNESNPAARKAARNKVRDVFNKRYLQSRQNQGVKFLYQKLRF